jgi:hypothetical protein
METTDVRFEIEERVDGMWIPCASHDLFARAVGYVCTHRRRNPGVELRVVRVDQVITESRTVVEGDSDDEEPKEEPC